MIVCVYVLYNTLYMKQIILVRRFFKMAKCSVCGKALTFGIKMSHSHRRSNRVFKPNIRRVKAIVGGTPCHVNVCTRCLRSGRVIRG